MGKWLRADVERVRRCSSGRSATVAGPAHRLKPSCAALPEMRAVPRATALACGPSSDVTL
eukprot:5006129-Alexandrium_andersonii.AAC.1